MYTENCIQFKRKLGIFLCSHLIVQIEFSVPCHTHVSLLAFMLDVSASFLFFFSSSIQLLLQFDWLYHSRFSDEVTSCHLDQTGPSLTISFIYLLFIWIRIVICEARCYCVDLMCAQRQSFTKRHRKMIKIIITIITTTTTKMKQRHKSVKQQQQHQQYRSTQMNYSNPFDK